MYSDLLSVSRLTAAALLALGFLSMTGCTLGPDYTRPSVQAQLPDDFTLPEGWKVAEPRDDEPLTDWWKKFGDTRLNRLMDLALGNNQNIAAAFHRVEQSRALSETARSAWFPGVNFEPSVQRNRRSATGQNQPNNLTGRTTTNIALPLVVDYELDLWGKLRRSIEAANAETLASEADFRQIRLALQAELATQYLGLRSIDSEIAIFQEAVSLRGKSLDLNQKRFDAGDTDEVDVSRAETELSAAQSELIGLRQSRAETENAIAVLVGVPSTELHLSAQPLWSTPPKIPVSVPCELLERRPDIAVAERTMMAENARIGVAEAAFFPTVKLNASVGLASGSTSQLFNFASHTWGLGPEISFPVFDAGKNRAELERSRARYDETVAGYRQTILQAVREVDDALVAVERLAERAVAQEQTVRSAARTVDLSRKRYDAGVVAYFDVVDAQRTELDARQGAARLRAARHLAVIALIKALGGGWE